MDRGQDKINIALWEAIKKGDEKAFQDLYNLTVQVLFNYGIKIHADRALIQDCIHDLFHLLWLKKEQLQIHSSLKQYLFTTFRRIIFDKVKQSQKALSRPPAETHFELSIESKIIEEELNAEQQADLNEALQQLTGRQKEILFLRYFENLPYSEIEVIMSLNKNSMYKLLSAAISRLRKQLFLIFYSLIF